MSTTYKPALLRALAMLCEEVGEDDIPLTRLAQVFLRLYWDQTVRFGLRQAPQVTKEPLVLQHIRSLSDRYNARDYSELPQAAHSQIATKLVAIITHDVIPRFHRSKPASMPDLYSWSEGDDRLHLLPDARKFLSSRRATVELIANYYWARRLERWNRLAPRVIEKVEGYRPPRSNVRRYLNLLLTVDPHCFYCATPLLDNSAVHVDHFISWNFLLEDYLWDLVPACSSCNIAKSDRLPPPLFVEKLAARNFGPIVSLAPPTALHNAADLRKLYDAAVSVEWPVWSPKIVTP